MKIQKHNIIYTNQSHPSGAWILPFEYEKLSKKEQRLIQALYAEVDKQVEEMAKAKTECKF